MQTLTLKVRAASVDADLAFELIGHFEEYPALVDEVRSVEVESRAEDGPVTSHWEVCFRSGPLRWSEVDYFQPARRRIVFEQIDGDFEIFRGHWQVEALPGGCEVTFEVTFDFGIPSLTGILDPIACKVLKEGIALVIHRLLGKGEVVDDPAVSAAVARKLALTPSEPETLAG
ncbi:type II toxin-antitoxin system RatA family toxin [Nocardia pseudovaccinii]|uniref:type II toxin-antitoxin system RatA family toxin n=1 Tax=Nocardia pseudovaccinii TaxID=189540 RepID=UPI0007A5082A|nr:SRPBCC family protein [Nocardia pseudovaccinii]